MEMGLRKAKDYFDTVIQPSHVTFDDGKVARRNFQWVHYLEARWDYAEPDVIRMDMGECVVIIK